MKHLLITFIALCIYSICANAQQTISLQQLKGTTWRAITPGSTNLTITFSGDSIGYVFDRSPIRIIRYSLPYYLETKEPTTYSLSKVGKNATGCYIVKYNTTTKDFYYYKIVSLKNDTLTVYYKPNQVIIGSKFGENYKYKRVK